MELHPTQRRQNRCRLLRHVRSRLRNPVHDIRSHGRSHESIEPLHHAEIHQVNPRSGQRWIQFRGAQQMLQSILHLVPLGVLPLIMRPLEDLVCLPSLPVARNSVQPFTLRHSADRQAFPARTSLRFRGFARPCRTKAEGQPLR